MDLIEEGHTRGNLKKLESAIINGFDIPQSILETAPKIMGRIMATGTNREKIAASRCIVAMQNSNQPQIQQHLHHHAAEYAARDEPPAPVSSEVIDGDEQRQPTLDGARSDLWNELTGLADSVESEADAEYLASLVDAYEQADRNTAKQRATLERLTQQAAAWLLGCTPRHIAHHQPARNLDGSYNGPEIVQWAIHRRLQQDKATWAKENESHQSAALRQAEARAIKLEEQAKALQDRYVLRESVQRDLSLLFGRLNARLGGLGMECANLAPGAMKSTIKQMVDERVRLALKELVEGATV